MCRAGGQDIMRRTQRVTCVIAAAVTGLAPVATLAVASAPAGGGPGQRARGCITVTATVPVGRSPEQVAVDPKTNTAYVASVFDSTVSVISGRTNTVTATIGVARYPYGVAVDPKTNTLYVTNSTRGTVSVISGRTNTVTATIPLAARFPQGIAVNPNTNTVYVVNNVAHTVSVISGRTN